MNPVTPGAGTPRRLNPVRDLQGLLVLPHTHDQPPVGTQRAVVASIPLPIRRELRAPPVGVRLRRDRVVGTAMPEATIDLHNDTSAREHDVRTARQTSHIHPIAQTTPMKFSADGKLGLGAGGPLPGHGTGHLQAGCQRSITGGVPRGHKQEHDPATTGMKVESRGRAPCGRHVVREVVRNRESVLKTASTIQANFRARGARPGATPIRVAGLDERELKPPSRICRCAPLRGRSAGATARLARSRRCRMAQDAVSDLVRQWVGVLRSVRLPAQEPRPRTAPSSGCAGRMLSRRWRVR